MRMIVLLVMCRPLNTTVLVLQCSDRCESNSGDLCGSEYTLHKKIAYFLSRLR